MHRAGITESDVICDLTGLDFSRTVFVPRQNTVYYLVGSHIPFSLGRLYVRLEQMEQFPKKTLVEKSLNDK